MTTATTTAMAWEVGLENVAWSRTWPTCEMVEVVTVTEKAVQLRCERTGRMSWFPKSAFEPSSRGTCFVVRDWFRAKMSNHQMKVLGYMA